MIILMRESFEKQPTSEIMEVGDELSGELDQIRQARINPETFKGAQFFNDEEIDADLAYVEEREKYFEEKYRSYTPEQRIIRENAEVIEVMMPMIIRDFDWLGNNTNIIYTSRYDDIANGIDSVAQLMEPKDTWNVGMEIDFTSSEAEMSDKILKIEARIKEGKMSFVKYFDSPTTGKLRNIKMPKVAFGAPAKEINDFVSIVADAYLSKNKQSAQAELRRHKLKDRFIELTVNQLREFGRVAMESGSIENARMHHSILEKLKQRKLV